MSDTPLKGRWGYQLGPDEIESKSFEIIDTLVELTGFTPNERALLHRVVHASGDPAFAPIMRWSAGALETAAAALAKGAPIVTDVEMARSGISKVRVAKYNGAVHCFISDPALVEVARERKITRSIAAVEKAVELYPEAVFVFGNAPTALFRLLELVDEGKARPALVVGVVVGFVGAAESKEALMARTDIPWISCAGNKGGSNIAAATANALYKIAAGEV